MSTAPKTATAEFQSFPQEAPDGTLRAGSRPSQCRRSQRDMKSGMRPQVLMSVAEKLAVFPAFQLPPAPARTSHVVFNKVVPNKTGLPMVSTERIQFLRRYAHDNNIRGIVRETEVSKHSKSIYSRTTFSRSGAGDAKCPYKLEMFHYLQKCSPHAENTTIVHAHS